MSERAERERGDPFGVAELEAKYRRACERDRVAQKLAHEYSLRIVALEAENARLRDVVEAAQAWADMIDQAGATGSVAGLSPHRGRALYAAIRAYEAQKEGGA